MLFYLSVVLAVHISVARAQNLLYYVTEETRVGHVITNLIQDGGISDDVSELRLLSRQSQNAPYFRLVTDTGDLIVAAVLDREEICPKVSVCDIELDLGVLNADHSTELIPFTIRWVHVMQFYVTVGLTPPIVIIITTIILHRVCCFVIIIISIT